MQPRPAEHRAADPKRGTTSFQLPAGLVTALPGRAQVRVREGIPHGFPKNSPKNQDEHASYLQEANRELYRELLAGPMLGIRSKGGPFDG